MPRAHPARASAARRAGSLLVVAPPTPRIRPALAADGPAIHRLVNDARLNPRDLDWRRFLVAEVAGAVVACAQVRVHGGGSRELASVAVAADHRGTGLGRAISEAAIAGEPVRPLYLYTESRTVPFWERFGFGLIDGEDVPSDLRGSLRRRARRDRASTRCWSAGAVPDRGHAPHRGLIAQRPARAGAPAVPVLRALPAPDRAGLGSASSPPAVRRPPWPSSPGSSPTPPSTHAPPCASATETGASVPATFASVAALTLASSSFIRSTRFVLSATGSGCGDLHALDLGLDHLEQRVAVLVPVLRRDRRPRSSPRSAARPSSPRPA